MYHNIIQRDTILTDLNNFQLTGLHIKHDTFILVLSENHRFAMSQDQLTLFLHLFIRDSGVNPVSKDHAVLKNFHDSSTFMTHTGLDNFCTQVDIHIQRTSEESSLRTDYQLSRVKRSFDCPVRRSFSFRTQLRGRRILSFR